MRTISLTPAAWSLAEGDFSFPFLVAHFDGITTRFAGPNTHWLLVVLGQALG